MKNGKKLGIIAAFFLLIVAGGYGFHVLHYQKLFYPKLKY